MTKTRRQRLNYLKKCLNVQSKSYKQENMVAFLKKEVNRISKGNAIKLYEDNGNLYITKGVGKTYPCVVAHMDTVHSIVEDFQIYELEDVLFSFDTKKFKQVGIGGDDKVGIFCALEALQTFDTIKIAFFRDEEVGCIGSGLADMDFFSDVSFVLQADRRGYKDFVRKISGNMLYDDKFANAIEEVLVKYGKEECLLGGSTDVNVLHRKGIGVAVANCSCGYYKPHSDGEYVVISEVFATSDLFRDIILEVYEDGEKWECAKYTPPVIQQRASMGGINRNHNRYAPKGYFEKEWGDNHTFHFHDDMPPNKVSHTKVGCPQCKADITNNYDEFEDGYYCHNCTDYRYVSTELASINGNVPNKAMITTMLLEYYNNKRKRKNRRKK